jgi:diguanylate cyclase (GGDEF)-like protein
VERLAAARGGVRASDLLDAAADLLAANAPVIVGAVGCDEVLQGIDGALTSQLGFTAADWVGRPLHDLVSDPSILRAVRDALAGSAGVVRCEVNGRPWTVACRPRFDPEGRHDGALVLLAFADQIEIRSALSATAYDASIFEALLATSSDFVSMTDEVTGRMTYLNPAGAAMVGLEEGTDPTSLSITDFFPGELRDLMRDEVRGAVEAMGRWSGSSELLHFVTGERIPVSVTAFVLPAPPGSGSPVLATVQRDVRQQVRSEAVLAERALDQRLSGDFARRALTDPLPVLLQAAVDLVAERFTDMTCSILRARPDGATFTTVASTDPAWISAVTPVVPGSLPELALELDRGLSSPDVLDDARFAGTGRAPELGLRAVMACPVPGESAAWGLIVPSSTSPRAWSDHDLAFVESVAATLGAAVRRHALEERLAHQALHDPLTGLPNRALVIDRIRHALRRSAGTRSTVAVLLLDLDDFKTVNDSLGHAVGDGLLAELAQRFETVVGAGDTVARLGGDEFVVVCEDVGAGTDVTAVAEALLEACASGVQVEGRRLALSASIGVTTTRGGSARSSDLLSEADIAMYRAKRDRPGTYRVFDEGMRGEVVGRLNLAGELRSALRADRIEVAYQPIVDLASGRVTAMEALARWTNDEGAAVPPDVFVPLAEETGLVAEVGRSVLRQAAQEAARWQVHGEVGLRVNASSHELRSTTYVEQVLETLREAGLAPERLGIEITESVLVEGSEATQGTLAGLHAAGIVLLIDDFGTGYSSLSYLQRFPVVDVLKIDRSFLRAGSQGTAVVEAIVALGRAFGLLVCAEGVETEEQHRLVTDLGCHTAQGYLLSRPVAAAGAFDLLAGWQPVTAGDRTAQPQPAGRT